ncbi:transglutaminase family protein [Sphingomonas sp. DBB INV C78]|uniref:transglutaminase-like domain-containing protein n=1 Tax=Sphingomonas sp. DBB INV C78 TaxID=3349434 RepID=UPI0036D2A687
MEQFAAEWPVFQIAPHAHSFPFSYEAGDHADLYALLKPQYPDPDGVLAAWARSFVAAEPTDTLSLLKDINAGMLARVNYRVREEDGTRSPLETLSLASGSCRDIAALFLEVVRHLGFGARAVSGYLHAPGAGFEDAGSTHPWAEIYLPKLAGSLSIRRMPASAQRGFWRLLMVAATIASCR